MQLFKNTLARLGTAARRRARHLRPAAPLPRFEEERQAIAFVDSLSDADLAELNGLLQWNAFTVDAHGRAFGSAAWSGKRDRPGAIPDRRIVLMDERYGLAGKHVLEVGCFEGIHTIGLARLAGRVTAVDGRVENVVKTIVRASMYGLHPTVFKCDVEAAPLDTARLEADLLHHVGVLYHLKDPARHLLGIGRYIRQGLMLDTHFAADGEADLSYEVDGRTFRYKRYGEYGHADVFSGLYSHSKWLPLDTIASLLNETGFDRVDVVETRQERNGPRVLLFATRS